MMKNWKHFFLATILSFFVFSIFSLPIFAQNTNCSGSQCFINIGDRQKAGGIPGIKAVDNPNASPGNLISNVLLIIYIAGGIAAFIFIVWGAFEWIISGGDKERVASARKKITNSLIGLAFLSLSAFLGSLIGQIVGINATKMGTLPTLDQQAPVKP